MKCSSSATVHPSQNASSAGPSRRRPRSQELARSSSIHHSAANRGRRNRRPAPTPSTSTTGAGSRVRGARSGGWSSRTGRSAPAPRATAAAAPARAAGPSRRTAPRGWPDRPAGAGGAPRAAASRVARVLFPEPACPSIATSRTGPREGERARRPRACPARSFMAPGYGPGPGRAPPSPVRRRSRRWRRLGAGGADHRRGPGTCQWTSPMLLRPRGVNHWPGGPGTRDSWRTDRRRTRTPYPDAAPCRTPHPSATRSTRSTRPHAALAVHAPRTRCTPSSANDSGAPP